MLSIGNLSGLFDGETFHRGPLSVHIENQEIQAVLYERSDHMDIDGTGKIASLPFADGHTHLIFSGTRFSEIDSKLRGKSYSEILAQGGGIKKTVTSTRQASDQELLDLVLCRLDVMLHHGTSIVEAKSGYGLDPYHELRLLRVLKRADQLHPVSVIPTFGGAHVYPDDRPRDQYLEQILDEMLPQVSQESLATSTDVFCDKGAFSVHETVQILEQSKKLSLPIRVHAEELVYTGIGKLASSEYGALSVDHVLLAREDDFSTYAANDTVAMFMPMAPLGLFSDKRPKGFRPSGVVLGLGSDFNPNNWVLSMQSALQMAVFSYRLLPSEALKAATMGSYQGITGQKRKLLRAGNPADLILIKGRTLAELVSKFGLNLVTEVILQGELVSSHSQLYNSHHS